MIGNVAEWVAQCANIDDGGMGTACQHRGGSFAGDLATEQCYGVPGSDIRAKRDPGLGFRCCARLTPSEQTLLR
jgi:hypothetical protein